MPDQELLAEIAEVRHKLEVALSELETATAQRDRYASLCGVAYQPDGSVRTGLEGAVLQQDVDQMRQQTQAVLNFLRDSNPFA